MSDTPRWAFANRLLLNLMVLYYILLYYYVILYNIKLFYIVLCYIIFIVLQTCLDKAIVGLTHFFRMNSSNNYNYIYLIMKLSQISSSYGKIQYHVVNSLEGLKTTHFQWNGDRCNQFILRSLTVRLQLDIVKPTKSGDSGNDVGCCYPMFGKLLVAPWLLI